MSTSRAIAATMIVVIDISPFLFILTTNYKNYNNKTKKIKKMPVKPLCWLNTALLPCWALIDVNWCGIFPSAGFHACTGSACCR